MGSGADSRTEEYFVRPDWPAPSGVLALCTTAAAGDQRHHLGGEGGPAASPLDLLSRLADSSADQAVDRTTTDEPVTAYAAPARKRAGQTERARKIQWLRQVHGTQVIEVPEQAGAAHSRPQADAAITRRPGQACAVLTADCLPVLFCSPDASVVAAAHAGWRGLASGILERSIECMGVPPDEILAWLGPAIGACHFEVGDEVRQAFTDTSQSHSTSTGQSASNSARESQLQNAALSGRAFYRALPASHPASERAMTPGRGKWLADLYALARLRLETAGLKLIYGGGFCTVCDSRFFSYRRQAEAGRMASVICRV